MQPKPKIYQFSSPLAPWFEAYLEEKHRLGYKYKGVDTLLKSLDTFLVGKDCKDSLSKDLLLEFMPHPEIIKRQQRSDITYICYGYLLNS